MCLCGLAGLMRELHCSAILLCYVSGKRQEFSVAFWNCVFLNTSFKNASQNHCVFSLATGNETVMCLEEALFKKEKKKKLIDTVGVHRL